MLEPKKLLREMALSQQALNLDIQIRLLTLSLQAAPATAGAACIRHYLYKQRIVGTQSACPGICTPEIPVERKDEYEEKNP